MTPPSAAGATAPPDNPQPTPMVQQNNTAANTQTTSATGGGGGRATGGNAGSQVAGGGSHGGSAYANGGNADSHSSLDNHQSNQISGRGSSGSGYSGNGAYNSGGQDVFVLKAGKRRGSGGAGARTNRARSAGVSRLGAANRATRIGLNEPRDHETAKASPLGGGLPGHGGQLPAHNPFFRILSGSGDAGAGLMLLLLAVLGASIALPNYRFKAFRTPAVTWRPLAYVPPIELPG